MLCRQEGHALSALSRAEREAREAVEAAGLAKQRSADFAARRVTGDGRRAGPRGRAATLRSGYVQLAEESSLTGDDAASPARGVVLRSLKAEDAGVDGCGGIAPPPPEDPPGCPRSDAASAHPASAELSGFSLSRSAGAGSGSKSGVHWIPMMDLRASRRTGRVNARLLLVSPQLHAKAVGRMPLVVVLWAVLIACPTLLFYVGVAPGLLKWGSPLPLLLPAITFSFCTGWMLLAGFTDPGAIPVTEEQRKAMGVTLDELAIKTATLTRLGRMQEAVVFLRQGKALKAEQDRKYPEGFCTACVHQRPPRAHHCRVTDRCIAKYDHYCCYIGTSVGLGNYKYFVLFVWSTLVHSCVVLTASATRLALLAFSLLPQLSASTPPPAAPHAYGGGTGGGPGGDDAGGGGIPSLYGGDTAGGLGGGDVAGGDTSYAGGAAAGRGDTGGGLGGAVQSMSGLFLGAWAEASPPPPPAVTQINLTDLASAWLAACHQCPPAVLLWAYCTLICLLLAGLGLFHAMLISRNLTTYEHAKRTYRAANGTLHNPFDRGLRANWAEALFPTASHRLAYSATGTAAIDQP